MEMSNQICYKKEHIWISIQIFSLTSIQFITLYYLTFSAAGLLFPCAYSSTLSEHYLFFTFNMFSTSILLPALLCLTQTVSSHPACRPEMNNKAAAMAKAVYILTNDETNGVLALPVGNDGTLSKGKVAKTGGAGSIAVDADGNPATPDALVAQSALTVAGNVGLTLSSKFFHHSLIIYSDGLRRQRRIKHSQHVDRLTKRPYETRNGWKASRSTRRIPQHRGCFC